MSAIWGMIDFEQKEIKKEDCRQIENYYEAKNIEKIQSYHDGSFYLGCALQYVNREAEKECYPYHTDDFYMVADAVVDNRKELQQKFSMELPLSKEGVDGSILFECLQQNLDQALDDMLGAYVFATYEKKEKKLMLANDALGNRSVYYMIQEDRFYFSTMMEPLLYFVKEKKQNDSWFFNFYIENSLRFVGECRQTPYENIFRLEPGELLTYSKGQLKRKAYWQPLKRIKTRKLSQQECTKLVQTVFQEAVERVLRDGDPAAILLSGGLDSNAVAAFAAPKLKSYDQNLYSFTSVPDAEHPVEITRDYYVSDEREYVELLKKRHSNLVTEWVGCNTYQVWDYSQKVQKILEIPYKSIPNLPWLYDSYARAREKGCRVLLTGQYGNITVSFGGFECLFSTLIQQGRFMELYRQICIYAKKYNRRRRWVFKTLLGLIYESDSKIYQSKDVNPMLAKGKTKEIKKLRSKHKFLGEALPYIRPYMYDRIALRQVGETELKLSMETGVIPRDPTRDKRFIELMLSLPVECFVCDGVERRLVRECLKDYIPKEITENIAHRGSQGVGLSQAIKEQWPLLKEKLKQEYRSGHGDKFLNLPYLLERIEEADVQEKEEELVRMVYCGLCSEYIGRSYGK